MRTWCPHTHLPCDVSSSCWLRCTPAPFPSAPLEPAGGRRKLVSCADHASFSRWSDKSKERKAYPYLGFKVVVKHCINFQLLVTHCGIGQLQVNEEIFPHYHFKGICHTDSYRQKDTVWYTSIIYCSLL